MKLTLFASFLAADLAAPQLPRFSWDSLPVAWHSALSRNFSAEELRILARYAVVTFEKSEGHAQLPGNIEKCQNGTDLSHCGCCEEDEMIRTAAALKAVDSNVHIIAYTNSIIAYPWYRAAHDLARQPDLWLRRADGSLAHNIKPGSDAWQTWSVWDHSQEAARDLYMAQCKSMTSSGVIDGCFMDGCKNIPTNLTVAKDAEYRVQKPAMFEALQQEVPGILICGSGGKWWDGMLGSQLQNWGKFGTYSQREIPMLQNATKAGVVFEAHGSAVCNRPNDPDHPSVQTELAAFLVAAGQHSYFMCSRWSGTVPVWFPVYDRPLGEPLGDALFQDGVYTRSFASGTRVTYNTTSEQGTIEWANTTVIL